VDLWAGQPIKQADYEGEEKEKHGAGKKRRRELETEVQGKTLDGREEGEVTKKGEISIFKGGEFKKKVRGGRPRMRKISL